MDDTAKKIILHMSSTNDVCEENDVLLKAASLNTIPSSSMFNSSKLSNYYK